MNLSRLTTRGKTKGFVERQLTAGKLPGSTVF
jgi:hypothetical protein